MNISDYLVPPSHIFNDVVKDDDRYNVSDIEFGRITVSRTVLYPLKATSGHSHDDQEEVYFFKEGRGKMWLDEYDFEVLEGDVVFVEKGTFHKVENTGNAFDLIFDAVFVGNRAEEAK
jgi:mannose-6-phosphate isomerase-like protein (cupin superfamily)